MYSEKQLQLIEILFLEAVHFHHIDPSFLSFAKSITLFAFLSPQGQVYKLNQSYLSDQKMTKYLFKSQKEVVCITESRDQKQHLIKYWIDKEGENLQSSCDFSLQLKCEVEIINYQIKSRSLIRVIIKRYSETPSNKLLFQTLLNMGNGKFVYKKNFCKFRAMNEIQCPSAKIIQMAQRQHVFSKDKQVVLCLNQSNLRQLAFFETAIERISQRNKITKIIGHPSSLFLTLLVKPNRQFDYQQRDKILRYKQMHMVQSMRLQTVTRQEIVKGILIRVFSQQNLLNPTLIQFLIDNIVNSEFVLDFVKLIKLYYQIFLRENVENGEVEKAIEHYFYQDQQYLQHHASSFSCLFNFVQWRHNMQCSRLLQSLQIVLGDKTRKVQELTLQDLYNYNGIQFTFIALDLTDKIVRFFNCNTSPNLPIVAILSLIQFLPTPYKSIYWRQQWGRYRIHYGNSVREINISQHEIVDTRFLLQSPLDLLENKDFRDCYMKIGRNQVVHAVSTARKKATEMPEIQSLKTLLKEMKSKAIDAIPKLKLVWKILTTKNRIELDLNNFQTFQQIPIIGHYVSLDETFKVYLDNLNREANNHRTIIQTYPILDTPLLALQKMSSSLNSISHLLSEFMSHDNLLQRTAQDFCVQLDKVEKQINQYSIKSYDEYLYTISKIQDIIKLYPLQGKYRYRAELDAIIENIGRHGQVVDCLSADSMIKQVLASLKSAKLRVKRQNERQNDINSSSFMRDTYTPINGFQRVPERLAALYSQYKLQQKAFENIHQEHSKRAFIEYEKILYRLCKGLKDTFQRVSESKSIQKLYANIYNFTPYLYQLQRMEAHQLLFKENMKNSLPSSIKSIHIVLNGQPNRLIYLGRQLIRIRNSLDQAKITNVTSTNYHSVAAMLFSLGLDDETFMQELMGLQKLVETHPQQDQSMDLVEMLLKGDQRYISNEDEQCNEELCLNIAKKYQNAFKLLVQLEATAKKTRKIQIIKLYQLIDQYDKEQLQLSSSQKQKEIVSFLQDLLALQKEWLNKAALICENKEMIQEKMKLNKVGIRFMIRFLYRNPERQSNWLKIHLREYKSLHLYHQHLCQLFSKYNLSQKISLKQFNSTNALGIHLNFVLINYHRNRYETFNSKQRGSTKLIDLLTAAVSCPLDFPSRQISIREFDNAQMIPIIIRKNQKKFIESSKDEAYWSNYGCNSMPLNLLKTHESDSTFYCCLQFVDEALFLPQQTNRRSLLHRDSLKANNEQKDNLRALDLLSMWWTKSKKLTRQMKEILFGSIFDSPFLYYYYILQNSSYQALLQRKDKRNLVNLNQLQQHLQAKGRIIGECFDGTQKDCLIFKLKRLEREFSLQVVMIRANLEMKVEGVSEYLQEGQEHRIERHEELVFKVFRFTQETLEKYDIEMAVLQRQGDEKYYKITVNDVGTVSMIDFTEKSLKYLPLHCNCQMRVYHWIECNICEEHKNEEGSTCSTCLQQDAKAKRGSLNLYLLAYEATKADFQLLKDKVIQQCKKTAVATENSDQHPSFFCCIICCYKQTRHRDTL